MSISTTTRNLIIALVIFAGICSLTIWLRLYLYERSQTILEAMAATETEAELAEQLAQLEADVEISRVSVDEISRYILADERDTIQFLSLIDELATQAGVELETDSLVVIETDTPQYDVVQVSINIDGRTDAVESILNLLEVVPYHSHLVQATFERSRTEVGEFATAHVVLHISMNKAI